MNINIQQWRSPITIISALSILGGIAYMISPVIAQYGMSLYPVSFEYRILQFSFYSFIHG